MTTTKRMLTDKYNQVKYKLGRIPTILDFYKLGEIDPMLFIKYAKTYDSFLRIVDKDYNIIFTDKEEQILAFVSALIIDGKRPHLTFNAKNDVGRNEYRRKYIRTAVK